MHISAYLSALTLPASAVLFGDLPSAWLLNTFPVLSVAGSYLSSSASLALFVLAQYVPVEHADKPLANSQTDM